MMLKILKNPLKNVGIPEQAGLAEGEVSHDAKTARALYGLCPVAHSTDLHDKADLAAKYGVGRVSVKDERSRMGLGSFKALGATYAIAKFAQQRAGGVPDHSTLAGETYVCASAGNHGLSLAAGARLFGAKAVVYLSETVPVSFGERLESLGATVVREGAGYEASLEASQRAAEDNGWRLLADGTWEGYVDPAKDIMEGYLIMGHEMADQMADQVGETPTHIFLQAGVGGLAVGAAVAVRDRWGKDIKIVVVEPSAAPALIESVKAEKVVDTQGPVSNMGRLDCKTPSHLALKYLALEADYFLTIDDDPVAQSVEELKNYGLETSPSGGAGIAAFMELDDAGKAALGITSESHVVGIISEGA